MGATEPAASVDVLASLVVLDGVQDSIAAARAAVDRLRAHRAMRRSSTAVRAESVRRGAATAAFLQTGAESDPPAGTEADAVALGAGRAYGELSALSDTWRRAPMQALARIHLLVGRGWVAPEWLGRPRSGPPAAERLDTLLRPAPEADVVAVRLEGLLHALSVTSAPALVVAAVVHAEVATLRPFVAGNQVVALVAQRIVLIDRGLDPGSHAVVEVGHRLAGATCGVGGAFTPDETYAAALGAYASGGADGVAAWLRHCGEAVTAGAVEGLAICESIGR